MAMSFRPRWGSSSYCIGLSSQISTTKGFLPFQSDFTVSSYRRNSRALCIFTRILEPASNDIQFILDGLEIDILKLFVMLTIFNRHIHRRG